MENIEVVLGEGKEQEVLSIERADLENVKAAIESTAGAFKKWKNLVPVFLAYSWAGPAAFEQSDSEERKRLHRFIKTQSKAWARAELELAKMKNALDDDKKNEHKALAGVYKNQASTVATVAIARMVKYYEADQVAEDDGDGQRRERKSPRQKIEEFCTVLGKFSDKDIPEADKRIAREALNALRVVLSGRGVEIPIFGGMEPQPQVATHPNVGAEAKKPSKVKVFTQEEIAAL